MPTDAYALPLPMVTPCSVGAVGGGGAGGALLPHAAVSAAAASGARRARRFVLRCGCIVLLELSFSMVRDLWTGASPDREAGAARVLGAMPGEVRPGRRGARADLHSSRDRD